MYKAIGEDAYNDGLFSQAAPLQRYQASVSQFNEGSLGATSWLVANTNHARMRRRLGASRRPPCPSPRDPGYARARASGCAMPSRPIAGLGHTFLPAFTPREMSGLGQAYHDGSLGDDLTVSLPGVSTSPAKPAWKPDLASVGIGVMAGALLLHFVKF
jgi:hypothetical protein